MARVFVFNVFGSHVPSVEEVSKHLPPDAKIIAYNVQYSEMSFYYMVAFDSPNEHFAKWCEHKDKDVPIYLGVNGKWRLRS